MPTKVGIHDFAVHSEGKSWMPTFVGMTGRAWIVRQLPQQLLGVALCTVRSAAPSPSVLRTSTSPAQRER